jgi:transposase-like protein
MTTIGPMHNLPYPGEFIREIYLSELQMSVREVAARLQVAPSTLNRILQEQALLDHFRAHFKERVATTGLTVNDIRQILKGMRSHPDASSEAARILMEGARSLPPGQRLVTFDWD